MVAVSSEQAHLIEIREAENEWYQRESEKTIEISTPVNKSEHRQSLFVCLFVC